MNEKFRFDFMGKKYWWFAISGTIILIGLASLLIPLARGEGIGLNLSIDFKSGSRLVTRFGKDPWACSPGAERCRFQA